MFSQESIQTIAEKIVNKLRIHPKISLEEKEGKQIIKIEVSPSGIPISLDGRYYKRVGNTTREMTPDELKDFLLKGTHWDSMINEESSFDDIDTDTVRMFIRMAKETGRQTIFTEDENIQKIFEHLGLAKKGKLTNASLLLFGKHPQKHFINASLRVIRLKNLVSTWSDFKYWDELEDWRHLKNPKTVGDKLIEGNLFKQIFEGESAIKSFIDVIYDIKGLQRKEIWDYPLPAIREALINALAHRDYFKPVQTQVKIFDDHIWFYNIGTLPGGLTVEDLKKPHPSIPRNPLIARILYLAGFIEVMGSGIGRMIDSLKSQGLPEPDFKEEMGGFSVRFYKDIYTEENLRAMGLNERQIKAVLYVKEKGKITNREYQELTLVSKPTSTRDLQALVELGLLEQRGITGKGTYYVLVKGLQTAQRTHKGLTKGSKE